MSVTLIGPGPLEGGPMVSPGPAKSGDDFSAHLKQACDQPKGESSPPPSSPSVNGEKKGECPAPSQEKEKGLEIPVAEVTIDPAPVENPPPIPGPNPVDVKPELNLLLAGSKNKSEIDPAILIDLPDAEPLLVQPVPPESTGESLPVSESPESTPTEPKIEKKEDPAKAGPVPIPLTILMPTAPVIPVESTPHEVLPKKEDPAVVQEVLAVKSGSAPDVPVLAPLPDATPSALIPPKVPDTKTAVLSDAQPKGPVKPKQKGPSLPTASVDGVVQEPTEDQPPLQTSPDPSPQRSLPELAATPTPPQEKEGAKEAPPPPHAQTTPAPIHALEGVPTVPLTTDNAAKPKESLTISAVSAAPSNQASGPESTAGAATPPTPPVSEARTADVVRPPAPVVTPSPMDLARQIHVHLDAGRSVVRIDLHPNHLGELRISMETKGKDVSMQFTVDNDNARQTVVAGLREITGTLSTLGWSVTGLAVHVSSGGVGNGRGEANGLPWGPRQNTTNNVLPETTSPAPESPAGGWRVDLVA